LSSTVVCDETFGDKALRRCAGGEGRRERGQETLADRDAEHGEQVVHGEHGVVAS